MHSLLSRPHSHEEDACSHYHRSSSPKDDQYEIAHTGNLPPSSEVVGSAGGNHRVRTFPGRRGGCRRG